MGDEAMRPLMCPTTVSCSAAVFAGGRADDWTEMRMKSKPCCFDKEEPYSIFAPQHGRQWPNSSHAALLARGGMRIGLSLLGQKIGVLTVRRKRSLRTSIAIAGTPGRS